MRSASSTFCLLTFFCAVAGCSQTGGFRAKDPSNLKTVTSVGDKPLPIVAGESGATLRAETEDLDRPVSSGSQISGRVYDERGKPVPGAKVRLGVGKAAGGKLVAATTDRSGAFTLHGLRPGSSYTVLAEYQTDDGKMFGRVQAKAPHADLRIPLQPRDGDSTPGHSSIRPAKSRVEPISNGDAADDERLDENGGDTKFNAEDTDPPAEEAVTILPRNSQRTARASNEDSQAPVRAGWNLRQPASQKKESRGVESGAPDTEEGAASGTSAPTRADAVQDDDGPNPLPPAIEHSTAGKGNSTALSEDKPLRVAQGGSRRSRTRRASTSDSIERGAATSIDLMDESRERAPRPMPSEIVPGERVITSGSYGPIVVTDPKGTDDRTPQTARPARGTEPANDIPAIDSRSDDDPPGASDPSSANDASATARRPTWRELSLNQGEVPVDESIQRASGTGPAAAEGGVITLTSAKSPAKPRLAQYLIGSRPAQDDAASQSVCRFDPTERRLIDFKLPDMTGKIVSLHDLDADVILLDFWGSWCAPCRKSIAHLIELQAKASGKQFQVVGIACEKAPALADRQASAAKAMKELGINYPVLLSTMDGPCPVQQALQIQFYPTMVLVDREGRLLAREQGATEITLQRIDRAIDSAFRHRTSG